MILEGEDKIKDLFSAKLQSFEPELPASLWVGIDQVLSQQVAPAPTGSESASTSTSSSTSASSSSSVSSTASTVGKATVWMKPVAAVATAVAVTVAGVVVYENTKDKEVQIVEKLPEKEIVHVDTALVINEDTTFVADPNLFLVDSSVKTTKIETEVRSVYFEKVDTVSDVIDQNTVLKNEIPLKDNSPLARTKILKPKVYVKPKGFTMGVASNISIASFSKNQQGGTLTFGDPEDLHDQFVNANNNYKMKHSQPLSFGLTVSKELTPNLSIETGVIYSYLSSTIESNDNYIFKEKQNFHYLGIPVSLNYTFFKYNKLSIYFSMGGMIQKDIKGTYKGTIDQAYGSYTTGQEGTIDIKRIMNNKKDISQSNPQFSTHLSLGISYPLYKKLYLYGTVGGAYYFDASNKYRTIYSDKQTQFNMNLGLKWKF